MLPASRSRSQKACLRRLACLVLAVAVMQTLTSPVSADPNWSTLPYTPFHVMQDVNSSGNPTWAVPIPNGIDPGYKLRGVVLNRPEDLLDTSASFSDGPQWFMGGQWQIFLQPVSLAGDATLHPELVDDYAGAALWMGQNYGNHIWHWNLPNRTDYSYTNSAWTSEQNRLNYPIDVVTGLPVTEPLRPGDVIEVRARGGLNYQGKFNTNEEHDNDPALNFDLFVLQRDYARTAAPLSLADLKDSGDQWLLDPETVPVAERYQSTLICLQDVSIQDPQNWTPGSDTQPVTLTDGQGRTIPMLVGRDPAFPGTAPGGTFDVVAIFDQASYDFKSGYRLWVVDPTQFDGGDTPGVPEPATAALLVVGSILAVRFRRVRRQPQTRFPSAV